MYIQRLIHEVKIQASPSALVAPTACSSDGLYTIPLHFLVKHFILHV